MNLLKTKLLYAFILLLSINACKKDEGTPTASCDETLLPVIMLHGSLGSGDTYANHFMRFVDNNYCVDKLFAYDWNSLDQATDHTIALDAFIDEVLTKTGATSVNLAGHSAGGGLATSYIESSTERAAKISHYAHIGSFVLDSTLAEVRMLNLWSDGDLIVPGNDIPGAENVKLAGQDHYQVATSRESFEAIYTFFNDGKSPATTSIESQQAVWIYGKALTFGENNPLENARIEIFELDPETGARLNATADKVYITEAGGSWGPFFVNPEAPYEFYIQSEDPADRPIHYYRENFSHSNQLVYLRTMPPPSSLAGALLAALPNDDDQSVVAIFSAAQAIIEGRDELSVNSINLATNELASAEETAIAFFIFDEGDDQLSNQTPLALFSTFPFLSGLDLYLQATTPATIKIDYNGRSINIPNWKSDSEGLIVAVFN